MNLLKSDNEQLTQSNDRLMERIDKLVKEMQEERTRAVLEMNLLQREMNTMMSKFSIEEGDERSHVQRLLHGT